MQGFFIPETSDKAAAYLRCSNETKTITVKGNPARILAYMETQRNSNLCPNLQALEPGKWAIRLRSRALVFLLYSIYGIVRECGMVNQSKTTECAQRK